MLSKLIIVTVVMATLAALPGCIVHPGYYSDDRGYYYESYPLYYGPYIYAPFWFGGHFRGNYGHGHGFHGGRR
ncbi:hypothetical protein [Pelotalea chapellei]|uniref:Uncharacterized protein n=1 Tax=Pelotalea chapellei TaxID=44671 RepID=A0ABS5U6Y4_9BACT|nr:hypothetical protein [Pelotalea chapellei]MBT1071427.1 hypothetical protein [Pelotalea chapellei]